MSRRPPPWDSAAKRNGPRDRLEQSQSATREKLARFAEQKAAREAEVEAKLQAEAARPRRDLDAVAHAVAGLPLYETGAAQKIFVSALYRQLVSIAAETVNTATARAVLCWPGADPSPSGVAALLALADCAAAAPVKFDQYSGLARPFGLRALIYPYARSAHRALRHLYVDKDYLADLHIKHQLRSVKTSDDAALEDYHKTIARVRDLTGRATDGQTYVELRHPCIDELVPSGPCSGPEGRSALLWRVGAKTDLKSISRTRIADKPEAARFYMFGLRANDPLERLQAITPTVDIVLLDLDHAGRHRLGRNWMDPLKLFIAKLGEHAEAMPILAITDDPFAFDAVRFEALGAGGRRRDKRTPCESRVLFAQTPAIAVNAEATPEPFETVEKWEVNGFSGELGPLLERIRAAAQKARTLGDKDAARHLRSLTTILRRCACLPGSLDELSGYIAEESGEFAAADMISAYRVGSALHALRTTPGAYAQHEHASLLKLCSDVQDTWTTAARSGPMAPLLLDVIKSQMRASSRSVVLFPKDTLAEFAEVLLCRSVGEALSVKVAKGMVRFIDRAGLDDLAALPPQQRNQTKTLIMVAPPRSSLLALLARPWLPDNVTIIADGDALAGAAHDADRLAKYDDLAPLAERLRGFATKARAEARRLANAAVDFEPEELRDEDIEFPLSGVVNLAGNLRAGQAAFRFEFDGGQVLIAKPGTKLVVQDRKRTVPVFAEVEARNVDEGDRVCVIGDAFLEMARPLLNITARAAEEIRDYHDLVLDRFARIEGASRTAKLAKVVATMGMQEVSIERAAYWVDLEDQRAVPLHEVVPHAPRDQITFQAFMKALGVSDAIAGRYWLWAVIAQRTSRLRAAMTFHDAYRGILVDPYAAQSDNPERAADVRRLKAAAESHVSVVRTRSEERGQHVGA